MTLELDDIVGMDRITILLLRARYRRNATELCDFIGDDKEAADLNADMFNTNLEVLARIDRALMLKRKAGAR